MDRLHTVRTEQDWRGGGRGQMETVKSYKTNILLNHINRFKQMPNCDSSLKDTQDDAIIIDQQIVAVSI